VSQDRPISLHHLTALDSTPAELVAIAGALACSRVCLFTNVPESARHLFPMVTPDTREQVSDALAQEGVRLHNIEVFPLMPNTDLSVFHRGLELGAILGAARATAHIHIAEQDEAIDAFGLFCDLAAEYRLEVGLEFNAFSKIRTPSAAAAIVHGAARANGDIVLDLLHAVRSGASAYELRQIAPIVGYAQICDGPLAIAPELRWHEAVDERALPGTGAFPIAAIIAPLRADVVIEVEVPQTDMMRAGVTAIERARRAIEAARRFTNGATNAHA
jgi:sugar phosphate isomerase/epimerase